MNTVWKRIKITLLTVVLITGMCGCTSSRDKNGNSTFEWIIGTAVVVTGLMIMLSNNETDIVIDNSTREYAIERHIKKLVKEQTDSLMFIKVGIE